MEQLTVLEDIYYEGNNKSGAMQVLESIISLNPPERDDYLKKLNALKGQ